MKASMPAELDDDDLMEDSDSAPSGLEDDEEQDENEFEDEPEDESEGEENQDEDEDEDEDDREEDEDEGDGFDLAEASDAEDLLPLDADVPTGLIEFDGSDAEDGGAEEEWGGVGDGAVKKRKRGDNDKNKRKKLKSLPTFASYEDYAKLIEDGPEDNI